MLSIAVTKMQTTCQTNIILINNEILYVERQENIANEVHNNTLKTKILI